MQNSRDPHTRLGHELVPHGDHGLELAVISLGLSYVFAVIPGDDSFGAIFVDVGILAMLFALTTHQGRARSAGNRVQHHHRGSVVEHSSDDLLAAIRGRPEPMS